MSGRRARRGALHYVWLGISGGLLALVAALAAVVVVIPALSGSVALTILTSSMEPGLPPGTLIVVHPTPTEDITVGSIITYQIESGKADVVTHRVVGVESSSDGETTFIAQGDNNPQPDSAAVIPAQIKGTVWYSVPFIGFAAVGLGGTGKSWLVTGIAIALLVYATYMIVSALRGRRRETASEDDSFTPR